MDDETKRKAEKSTGSTPDPKRQEHDATTLLQAFAKAPPVPAAMEAPSAAAAIAEVLSQSQQQSQPVLQQSLKKEDTDKEKEKEKEK